MNSELNSTHMKLQFPIHSTSHSATRDVHRPEPSPPAGSRDFNHILIPLKPDKQYVPMLNLGLKVANALGAAVSILHILTRPQDVSFHWLDAIDSLHAPPPGDPESNEQSSINTSVRGLHDFVVRETPASLRESIPITIQCRVGSIATEVACFADEHSADLVLLRGGRSRSLYSLFPTLADQIMRATKKPIFLFHARQQACQQGSQHASQQAPEDAARG